jgi:hypothetical protein
MYRKKIKLGLAPTRRYVFSVEDAHRYKKLVEDKLRQWDVDFVTIDEINEEGLLFNKNDSAKAALLLKKAGIDALFCPHVNFGTEEAVAQLAKDVGKPFLLWGPRDEAPLHGEYSLFMGHARGGSGPYALGTYVWIEVPDWPLWEERLIKGPYIHHVAAVHDHAAYALYEAVQFIPGLRPDPAQPTKAEIKAYLRGN